MCAVPVWPVRQLEMDDHPTIVLAAQSALAAPGHVQLPHAVVGGLGHMVRVTCDVTLCPHLCPVKQLHLNVSELPDVPHIVWPVFAALDHAPDARVTGLHTAGQHHHHTHPVLPDHRPEGGGGVRPRALGRDVHPGGLSEHVLDERGVYVVAGLRVALDPVAGGHGYTVVVIGHDVLVPAR